MGKRQKQSPETPRQVQATENPIRQRSRARVPKETPGKRNPSLFLSSAASRLWQWNVFKRKQLESRIAASTASRSAILPLGADVRRPIVPRGCFNPQEIDFSRRYDCLIPVESFALCSGKQQDERTRKFMNAS